MTTSNATGYEVQVYLYSVGWHMESDGYATLAEAEQAMQALPFDGLERRVYESLERYL